MSKKYVVELSDAEREELNNLVNKGKTQGYRIKHAQILLALDRKQVNLSWPYQEISKAYRVNQATITQIAKRFVENGVEAALGRKEQVNRHRKIDGKVEAHIVAITCSEPPKGREHWTLQLIADELVRLQIIDSISDTAVLNTLKKTNSNLGRRKNGVFQKQEQNL